MSKCVVNKIKFVDDKDVDNRSTNIGYTMDAWESGSGQCEEWCHCPIFKALQKLMSHAKLL